MSIFSYIGQPEVGQQVSGMCGKRLVVGTVLGDPKNPRKPFIRVIRNGCVFCVVQNIQGRKHWINEIQEICVSLGYKNCSACQSRKQSVTPR